MRALEQLRLVAGDARKSAHVHRASPREIAEIFNVRAALEGMAASNIVSSPSRQAIVKELQKHLPPDLMELNFREHMNKDMHFHRRLCEFSGNSVLLEQWCGLEDRIRIVFFSSGETQPIAIMGRCHHEPILRCIERGDALKAQEAVRAHMQASARVWAPGVQAFG